MTPAAGSSIHRSRAGFQGQGQERTESRRSQKGDAGPPELGGRRHIGIAPQIPGHPVALGSISPVDRVAHLLGCRTPKRQARRPVGLPGDGS